MRYTVRIVHERLVDTPDGSQASHAEDLPDTFATVALAERAAGQEVGRLQREQQGARAHFLILDSDGDGVDHRGRKLRGLPPRP